ncbi:hypothetical protein F5148DRAFT_540993 [Russula earlei]|uniref:Uncharacterized protein n=1 Tax=Russula earlei TaxID=71964 RepID=A0ACC0UG95_9AGAM|nr:hypothetical protein F5148DRAFT_540993 [Russula earlei]
MPYTPSSASVHPILQDRFVIGSTNDVWVARNWRFSRVIMDLFTASSTARTERYMPVEAVRAMMPMSFAFN